MILYHVTETKNLENIKNQGLIAQIGQRSLKIKEYKKAVYFFKDIEAVENALENWLGDQFDEDAELALLAVNIPNEIHIFDGAAFEHYTIKDIEAKNIRVLSTNILDQNNDFFNNLKCEIQSISI